MAKRKATEAVVQRARPLVRQRAHEFQAFTETVPGPPGTLVRWKVTEPAPLTVALAV